MTLNYLTDAAGCRWSMRRTCVASPQRAYAFRRLDECNAVLPDIIGFYASTISEAKARLERTQTQ
jgi:hypothetical protein